MSAGTQSATHGISILVDNHRIQRVRQFAISGRDINLDAIAAILFLLRSEHATGRVCIDISQGSPGTVQFEESQKIT